MLFSAIEFLAVAAAAALAMRLLPGIADRLGEITGLGGEPLWK